MFVSSGIFVNPSCHVFAASGNFVSPSSPFAWESTRKQGLEMLALMLASRVDDAGFAPPNFSVGEWCAR